MKISKIPVFIVTFLMMFTLSCGLVGATDFVGGEFVDLGDVPKEEEIIEEPPTVKPPTQQPSKEEPPVESMPIVKPPEIVEEIPSTGAEPKAVTEPNQMLMEVSKIRVTLQVLVFGIIPIMLAVWITKNIIFAAFKRFF